jgi:hypothetical protein
MPLPPKPLSIRCLSKGFAPEALALQPLLLKPWLPKPWQALAAQSVLMNSSSAFRSSGDSFGPITPSRLSSLNS